jgi:hypothetical protein
MLRQKEWGNLRKAHHHSLQGMHTAADFGHDPWRSFEINPSSSLDNSMTKLFFSYHEKIIKR